MKLLLGFSMKEAQHYAREHHWIVREGRIYTADGEKVIVVLGDSRTDCDRLAGITLRSPDDIVMGPLSCKGIVVDCARRVKPYAGDAS